MRPILTFLAPDQQIYRRQRQTGGGIHRPDDGNPAHGMTSSGCDNLSTTCGVRLKQGAPMRIDGLVRPWIAASVGSLIQRSPTTTTQRGSVPARTVAPFFTGNASFNNQYKLQQSEIRVFYENTSGN